MLRKFILTALIFALLLPAGLFAEGGATSSGLRLGQLQSEEAPEETDEPIYDGGLSGITAISGRGKLVLGLSLSALGAGLVIMGEIYRQPFLDAREAYKSIDPNSASVADITAARDDFEQKRLLHYIPLFSGIAISGVGLFITIDGAFSVDIYEPRQYTPNPVIPQSGSGFLISPNFNGLVLRF